MANGVVPIPIGMRIWHPGEKSKIELALELLSYVRNQLVYFFHKAACLPCVALMSKSLLTLI